MKTFLLIAGDFSRTGGMDRANYELAWHLAESVRARVHLVGHAVANPLAQHPLVVWHRVVRPLNRDLLGASLLARRARLVSAQLGSGSVRIISNGGNASSPDVNWVHAVHAFWTPRTAAAPALTRCRVRWVKAWAVRAERRALQSARLVIGNSRRVCHQILQCTDAPPSRVHTVYYGTDPAALVQAEPARRQAVRRQLGLPADRPLAVFIGALGDDRTKGIDVAFETWERLCRSSAWDVDLAVAGAGSEVPYWRRRARMLGLQNRIHLLGFVGDTASLLGASDVLVSPTHYDGYGLGVHEALCCGLPAFVTRTAGIAERYPSDLHELLLVDPPEPPDLVHRLVRWRAHATEYRRRLIPFTEMLRARTWADMGRDIHALLGAAPETAQRMTWA